MVNDGNAFFNYYSVLSSLDEANKKLFDFSNKYVKNNLFGKAGDITSEIYSNGLANPLPFDIVSGQADKQYSEDNSNLYDYTDTYIEAKLIYGFTD
ncbi:MAG: hypothetical protein K2M43_00390 [Mycoplasmoidaceae bacterium]|nr:hypothetical protein [Mycoplasmoidaceae bacterium]